MIIGITGRMQHGKDTLAKMIKEIKKEYQIIHFADPLKDMCKRYFGLSQEDVNTSEGKKRYNEFWGMTNRQILQKIGTDAMRNGFCFDVWCKIMELRLNKSNNLIIPDVRFNDEAKLILNKGGIIIKIERNIENESIEHVSEKGINISLVTLSIDNNGTLEELKEKTKELINENIF